MLLKPLSEKDYFTLFTIPKFQKLVNSTAVTAYQRERLKALTFLRFWKINNDFIKCRCQSVQLLLLMP